MSSLEDFSSHLNDGRALPFEFVIPMYQALLFAISLPELGIGATNSDSSTTTGPGIRAGRSLSKAM